MAGKRGAPMGNKNALGKGMRAAGRGALAATVGGLTGGVGSFTHSLVRANNGKSGVSMAHALGSAAVTAGITKMVTGDTDLALGVGGINGVITGGMSKLGKYAGSSPTPTKRRMSKRSK